MIDEVTTMRIRNKRGLRLGVYFGLVFCLTAVLRSSQARFNIKDLGPKYQNWWKLVAYIITDKERDVFQGLPTDRDRDAFIESFWKQRDPTPGTPVNEFKDDFVKRFEEANKKFGRRSAREGWMTDQGRIYIILGPPISTLYLDGDAETYPAELWSYYGDTSKNLPPHFTLTFYQWHNMGEYKLYDPVSDGPQKLMVYGPSYNSDDFETMYQHLLEWKPDLAHVCLSIIPGEIPYNYTPSPQNVIYMAAIYDSPKKGLDESYATHFLEYRGFVSTEYLTNYIKSDGRVSVLRDPVTGLAFCDFAISPGQISVDFYEPTRQYTSDFQIDVSLRDGDRIIYQYSKDFPISIPEGNISAVQGMGFAIADSFPVIDGKYKLTVLLRNTVAKEFTLLESNVVVPADTGRPQLCGLVVGTKLTDAPAGAHVPFRTLDKKVNIDPKYTYGTADEIAVLFNVMGLTEDVWKDGRVELEVRGTKPAAPFRKTFSLLLSGQPYHRLMSVAQQLSMEGILPDYYDLVLQLRDGSGVVLDETIDHFVVSPVKTVPHPMVASKTISLANSFMFYYILAAQYDQTGKNAEAEATYKKAYELNPSFLGKIPEYSGFLLKLKKFDEALALVEKLKGDPNLRFQYFLAKGRALIGMERYPEALQNLQQGNKIYNSDAGLLSALGLCYYRLGQLQNALTALNASLKMNPEQPDVQRLIKDIEAQGIKDAKDKK